MKFFRNIFSILLFVMIFSVMSSNFASAQQISDVQRQALIIQLTQQIAQLKQQLSQMLLALQQTSPDVPIRLKITKINVDAIIEPAGIMPNGEMGVPKGPAKTAWFSLGPRPGDIGSAVINGHFGRWKSGEGSVFDNLNKLVKGDKIYVEDANGATTVFVVRELRIYDPNAGASDVFYSTDGKAHLNLITCEGIWNGAQKTYSNRLVVFADKE